MNRNTRGLVLNYRSSERTSRCIESLLANGVGRVLVWDNSADNGISAREILRQWQGDNRIIVHVSPVNLGFAAGVNRGLEYLHDQAPYDRVLLINNDACLLPGALVRLNTALDRHATAAIAYPAINQNGRILGTAYYQRYFGLLSFDKPIPGSFPYATGCALLLAPERINFPLFDEDFFMYGEDCLLGWQLGPERMAFVPQVLVSHEGNASSGLASPFYETRIVAGHWMLARKLAHNRLEWLLLLAGRFMVLTARAGLRTLRYRSFVPLHALFASFREAHRPVGSL